MIDYYEPRLDLTLLGCGFLGSYHLGAIYLLKQIWPQKPYNRICGASCGGLLGVLLVAGLQLHEVLDNAMSVLRRLRSLFSNPARVVSIKDLVEQSLEKLLPLDAHQRCSGRLGISVTKMWSKENKFISQFSSRRDLIEAVAAGCFIPLWSGSLIGPRFRGETYIDGAYSDNAPKFELTLDERHPVLGVRQVEISPFAGDVEVSPKDDTYLFKGRVMGTLYLCNLNNLIRTGHAMFPVKIDKYKPYLLGGHRDMKDYVLRTGLVKCKQCYATIRSTTDVNSAAAAAGRGPRPLSTEASSACLICLKLLERVDSLTVPQDLVKLLDD